MVATGYLYTIMPKGFFPQQDTGFIFGELNIRQDASMIQTDKVRRQVVDLVMHDPGVQGVFSYDGATPYNPAENTARIFWGLKPYDERDATADQIIQRLRKKVAAIQGAKFFMQVPQNITVGGRLSRTQYQYTLTDTNIDELNHWAPILEKEMKKLSELQDVASDQQIAAAHLAIDDRSRRRLSPRFVGARSTRRSTMRSASARSRRSTPRPINTRSFWKYSRNTSATPACCRKSTCPARAGCRCR